MEKTFKRDEGGINYAKLKSCNYVFFDQFTGKIWQWFGRKMVSETKVNDLRGYPHMANCIVMTVGDYERYCAKIESERYDTARNQ